MAVFVFKARDRKGRITEDSIESSSRKEAAAILRDQGLQVFTIREIQASRSAFDKFQRISAVDKALFCRYLSTMMKAGLPLPEAVDILAQETKNRKMHRILRDLQYSLQRGQKMSSVFARYPEVFDQVFLTLTRAGEESGTLEESFAYLANQLLRSYEISQKVKGALIYPAVIISAMLGVGILMVTFVLPRISQVFLRLNIKLPVATRILLETSKFLGKNYIWVFGILGLLVVFLSFLIRLPQVRILILEVSSKFPILARLFNQIDITHFTRTLSTLLKSGVPIVESIKVSIGTFVQAKFRRLGSTFEEEIKKGHSLSEAVAKAEGVFPAIITQSIRAGEKSGSLEVVLEEIADFYEQEMEHTLKGITAVLEPVLMLVIGIAVGALVIAVIAPIYSVIGSLQPQGPGL